MIRCGCSSGLAAAAVCRVRVQNVKVHFEKKRWGGEKRSFVLQRLSRRLSVLHKHLHQGLQRPRDLVCLSLPTVNPTSCPDSAGIGSAPDLVGQAVALTKYFCSLKHANRPDVRWNTCRRPGPSRLEVIEGIVFVPRDKRQTAEEEEEAPR